MPDRELDRELRELGALLDYPPTPDVAGATRRILDEENDGPRRLGFPRGLPRLRWAAVAAAFALIVAVPILSPGLRATVGDWFVAEDIQGAGEPAFDAGSPERQSEAGAPSAGVSKGGETLAPRFSGERIRPREARARMDGTLLLPRTLGKPDEVYAGGASGEDGVILVYRDGLPPLGDTGLSLVLTEVPGDVGPAYLRGKTPAGSEFERVDVDGDPGFWSPSGRVPSSMDTPLPGNVLLWEKRGVALRLEADVHKERAIRIAESVR